MAGAIYTLLSYRPPLSSQDTACTREQLGCRSCQPESAWELEPHSATPSSYNPSCLPPRRREGGGSHLTGSTAPGPSPADAAPLPMMPLKGSSPPSLAYPRLVIPGKFSQTAISESALRDPNRRQLWSFLVWFGVTLPPPVCFIH